MELAELTALLTPEGLRLVDEIGAIDTHADVATTVSRLRAAGLSPELVSAAVGQARLRTRARQKFGEFAERMLFTRAGLEQATRLAIGARHAGRFRDAGFARVADLAASNVDGVVTVRSRAATRSVTLRVTVVDTARDGAKGAVEDAVRDALEGLDPSPRVSVRLTTLGGTR